jgi:hypothetical protein
MTSQPDLELVRHDIEAELSQIRNYLLWSIWIQIGLLLTLWVVLLWAWRRQQELSAQLKRMVTDVNEKLAEINRILNAIHLIWTTATGGASSFVSSATVSAGTLVEAVRARFAAK